MNDLRLQGGLQHPALPALRLTLRQAMTDAGKLPAWTETYSDDLMAPLEVFAAERSVLKLTTSQSVPEPTQLLKLLERQATPQWHQQLSRLGQLSVRFISALFIAFFPKCPFCWAAYISYIGATGVVSVSYQPWLIYVLIVLLTANVGIMYWTRHRHGLGPFWLCVAGALLIITNRFWLSLPVLIWFGAGCLLIGSLWNSLSTKMTDSLVYFWLKLRGSRRADAPV